MLLPQTPGWTVIRRYEAHLGRVRSVRRYEEDTRPIVHGDPVTIWRPGWIVPDEWDDPCVPSVGIGDRDAVGAVGNAPAVMTFPLLEERGLRVG